MELNTLSEVNNFSSKQKLMAEAIIRVDPTVTAGQLKEAVKPFKEGNNGPSDKDTQELADKLYHTSWNSLSSDQQDNIFRKLGYPDLAESLKEAVWDFVDSSGSHKQITDSSFFNDRNGFDDDDKAKIVKAKIGKKILLDGSNNSAYVVKLKESFAEAASDWKKVSDAHKVAKWTKKNETISVDKDDTFYDDSRDKQPWLFEINNKTMFRYEDKADAMKHAKTYMSKN